jgi:hypothetical protein
LSNRLPDRSSIRRSAKAAQVSIGPAGAALMSSCGICSRSRASPNAIHVSVTIGSGFKAEARRDRNAHCASCSLSGV